VKSRLTRSLAWPDGEESTDGQESTGEADGHNARQCCAARLTFSIIAMESLETIPSGGDGDVGVHTNQHPRRNPRGVAVHDHSNPHTGGEDFFSPLDRSVESHAHVHDERAFD